MKFACANALVSEKPIRKAPVIAEDFGKPHLNAPPHDWIIWWHRNQRALDRVPMPDFERVFQSTQGLGDVMMTTDIPVAANRYSRNIPIWSASPHFNPVIRCGCVWSRPLDMRPFDGYWHPEPGDRPTWRLWEQPDTMLNLPDVSRRWDSGNGHTLQRLRRAFRLPVENKPKGYLGEATLKYHNRVILHFEPAVGNMRWQQEHVHPSARRLYPKTQEHLERWIRSSPMLEFVSIGHSDPQIAGARYHRTHDTASLIRFMSTASWFVGIISGPMHVATALGIRCVVIINFPAADRIFLPTCRVTGQIEEEWFYPQHVHLHQENEGPLVHLATEDNFKRAFDGELYPFWRDDWLPLIHETL